MDAHQDTLTNPFGMDEACENCSTLCTARERIVHGYGTVDADFLFVGDAPSAAAERTGVPFTGDERGRAIQAILGEFGFSRSPRDAHEPDVENVYLTYLARCRHPNRAPTDEEVATCEPYLNAEVRMINPELLIPIGQRPLSALAAEYTTRDPSDLDIQTAHATPIRGRGFELLPMLDPTDQTESHRTAFLDALTNVLDRDYRQTKGPRR